MKKFLSAIVFTLFVVFACNTADVSAATIGSGTEADPYISINHKTVELGETWSVKNFAYLSYYDTVTAVSSLNPGVVLADNKNISSVAKGSTALVIDYTEDYSWDNEEPVYYRSIYYVTVRDYYDGTYGKTMENPYIKKVYTTVSVNQTINLLAVMQENGDYVYDPYTWQYVSPTPVAVAGTETSSLFFALDPTTYNVTGIKGGKDYVYYLYGYVLSDGTVEWYWAVIEITVDDTGSLENPAYSSITPYSQELVKTQVTTISPVYSMIPDPYNGVLMPAVPVSWESSDTSVAVVDQAGNVTAVGAGSAKIRHIYGYVLSNGTAYFYYTDTYLTVTAFMLSSDQCVMVTSDLTSFVYNGQIQAPEIALAYDLGGGNVYPMTYGVDYTYELESADYINVGMKRIIVKGIGYFDGYQVVKYPILPNVTKTSMAVKVASPYSNEATVTWKKVKGASGYYVYRQDPGADYAFVANITDGDYQVFHDKGLKSGSTYSYMILPYVEDEFYKESVKGDRYTKPQNSNTGYYWGYDPRYTDSTGYYSDMSSKFYTWYNYSAIKGICNYGYTAKAGSIGSGEVTQTDKDLNTPIYTGDATMDYMAYLINKDQIKITDKMTDKERVKAIYYWMSKNTTFTKDVKDYNYLSKQKKYIDYTSEDFQKKAEAFEKKVQAAIKKGEALCVGSNWIWSGRTPVALGYRQGSCSYLTPMFNVLCNQAGIEAYIVYEFLTPSYGGADHNFTFAKIGDTFYWFDVPLAARHKNSASKHYMKDSTYFAKSHKFSAVDYDLKGYTYVKLAK